MMNVLAAHALPARSNALDSLSWQYGGRSGDGRSRAEEIMPISKYGVLVGEPVERKGETGSSPPCQVRVVDAGTKKDANHQGGTIRL
jgi:hypothetical protein